MKEMEKIKTIIAVMMACLAFISHAQSVEPTCWTTKGEQMKLPIEDAILYFERTGDELTIEYPWPMVPVQDAK